VRGGAWQNAGADDEKRIRRHPVSDVNPSWFILAWEQPQTAVAMRLRSNVGKFRLYAFTGGGFEPISRPIESSSGMTGTYMTGTYIDGRVYICDQGSGTIWSYDLDTQAWATESYLVPADGPAGVYSRNGYLFGGTMVGGTTSGTSSVLTFTMSARFPMRAASRSISGATLRQGPHHGAQKSTNTGHGT
jgi:hypothetical protein